MYFAEVALTPSQGTNLSMYDLSSVQVLKGPQGTLFGRNSTGGRRLVHAKTAGVKSSAGTWKCAAADFSMGGIEGAIDLPLGDKAALRFAGKILQRDGYQDNLADNALREKEKYWGRGLQGPSRHLAAEPLGQFPRT